MVESDSAQLSCGDAIPIRADHHDICKFASEKEEGFELIVAAIRKSLAPPADDKKDVSTLPFSPSLSSFAEPPYSSGLC